MTTGLIKPASLVFTIFGSTGDLTFRKLLPALYHLEHRKKLNEDVQIRCIGRKQYSQEEYWALVEPWLEKQSRFKLDSQIIHRFKQRIRYIQMEFTEASSYSTLVELGPGIDNLTYFAVAPRYFITLGKHLQSSGYLNQGLHRVILEKPFGDSLKHAEEVHEGLSTIFKESNIYHIDHYVGKEMIQNILALRFTNRLFESVWTSHHIAAIQITASETVGVETRGSYYEEAGALKDMVQNHLLQILSYVVMDKPNSLKDIDLFEKQESILSKLSLDQLVLGQYNAHDGMLGYTQEASVDSKSTVETFAALKAHLSEGSLKDVPIYLRTGKRLKHRATYIKVLFKPTESNLYDTKLHEVLTIKVQPDEGVSFQFNAKKPGTLNTITSVQMDFCQSCILENRINTPEAYEKLLQDAFDYELSLFTPWPIVKLSWMFGTQLKAMKLRLNPYPAGSCGPHESDEMLQKDGFIWLDENEYSY